MSGALVPIRLHHDAFGRLVVTLANGEIHTGVVPVRAFPFSAPDQWISLCDESGHEVFWLSDVAELEPKTRDQLAAELARREFIPRILRILNVVEGGVASQWFVQSDRGDTNFELPSEDNIRRMGSDGALLIDSHGIRYRITSVSQLDAHSRRILRRYL
ncbi:MAG: DUF1854 domain-containing protein [Polyangia bacterium]